MEYVLLQNVLANQNNSFIVLLPKLNSINLTFLVQSFIINQRFNFKLVNGMKTLQLKSSFDIPKDRQNKLNIFNLKVHFVNSLF